MFTHIAVNTCYIPRSAPVNGSLKGFKQLVTVKAQFFSYSVAFAGKQAISIT